MISFNCLALCKEPLLVSASKNKGRLTPTIHSQSKPFFIFFATLMHGEPPSISTNISRCSLSVIIFSILFANSSTESSW